MLVAEALVAHLAHIGVTRVYGYPGEDHMRLLEALEGAGLTYVPARSETAACMMAGADAQLTGRLGVVIITLAPGLTNAINGIANALLDGIPLLVICGQHPRDRLPFMVRQTLDNHRIVDGAVKWSTTAGARIHQTLARAIQVATTAPAGPVFLEVADETAAGEAADELDQWARSSAHGESSNAHTPAVSTDVVRMVAERFVAASRPAVLLGGFESSEAERGAIGDLVEATGSLVFTTPMAKGSVAHDHPRHAGAFYNGNLERQLLDRADFLLTINVHANDILNRPWPYTMPTVAIDRDPRRHAFFPVELAAHGGLRATLEAVSRAVRERGGSEWTDEEIADYRTTIQTTFSREPGDQSDGLTVPDVIRHLGARLPADTLLTVDAGFGKPIASMLWPSRQPKGYFASHGLSTMGYAIPSANALKAIRPEQTVVALLGDGSLLMSAPEIAVAVSLRIAPIYLVWLDGALLQIELKQAKQGLRGVGTDIIGRLSCAAIGEAFGGRGSDVNSLAELDASLDAAVDADLPSLIGIRVDRGPATRWYDALRG